MNFKYVFNNNVFFEKEFDEIYEEAKRAAHTIPPVIKGNESEIVRLVSFEHFGGTPCWSIKDSHGSFGDKDYKEATKRFSLYDFEEI